MEKYYSNNLPRSLHHGLSGFESPGSLQGLPDELIVEIFLHYRNLSYEYIRRRQEDEAVDPARCWWFVPTAICHRLRDIMLATPLFWSLIDSVVFSRHWTLHKTLILSQKTPLELYVYAPQILPLTDPRIERELESLGKILKESGRIRTLKLVISWNTLEAAILKEPHHIQFTMLESLEIHPLYSAGVYRSDDPVVSCFLLGATTSLRSWSLLSVFTDWGVLLQMPRTVTSLSIGTGYFLSCEVFLDVLERLPLLKNLQIGGPHFQIHQDGSLQHRGLVSMGNLDKLLLNYYPNPTQKVLSFMPLLSLPSRIAVEIHMTSLRAGDLRPETYPLIFKPIRRLLSHGEKHTGHGIRAGVGAADAYYDRCHFNIHIQTSTEGEDDTPNPHFNFFSIITFEDPESFSVDQSMHEATEGMTAEIYDLLDELRFEEIVSNQVREDVGSLGPTFARTLVRAKNIRLLQIDEPYMNHLFPALSPMDDGTVPVPGLRKLKLIGCPTDQTDTAFYADEDGNVVNVGIDGNVSEDSEVDADVPVHYVKADLNVLYTSLAARLEKGYKLEELELVNFELPTQEIYDLLTNAVEKLIDMS